MRVSCEESMRRTSRGWPTRRRPESGKQPWKLGSERTYARNSAQLVVMLSGVSEILSNGTGRLVGRTTSVLISVGMAVVVVVMMLVCLLMLVLVLVLVLVLILVIVEDVDDGRSADGAVVWCRVARRTNCSALGSVRVSASKFFQFRPRPISAPEGLFPATTPKAKVARTASTK